MEDQKALIHKRKVVKTLPLIFLNVVLLLVMPVGDVRRDAADCIGFTGVVAQQKFYRNQPSLPLSRGHGFLKLDGYAGFNHLPVIRAHRLGDILRKNIEVGLAADLVALGHEWPPLLLPGRR